MALDPDNSMFKWFKELVKNKMSAIAIPIAGISVSFTVLSFSKLFDFPIGTLIAWAGLVLLLFMLGLFTVSATILVVRNLREPPKKLPARGMGGRFIERPQQHPMPAPAQQPAADADPQRQSQIPGQSNDNGS